MRTNGERRPRRAALLLGGLVCVGLLAAPVTPAQADEPATEVSDAVGGFGVGDGIEALVDERDGALTFALPAAGLDLTWDSRAVSGAGRFGLGPGWGLGLGAVQTSGGVQFSPASGGRYQLDRSHPSGLHGYGARDVAFRVVDDGRVAARADGTVGERAYRYRLQELGGVVTSFDAHGDPVRGADGATYAYDAANRQISRTRDGQTVHTSYWGDGSRRSLTRVGDRVADPVATTYYWDGGTLVNDVHAGAGDAADAGTASYLLGASRHARTTTDDEGVRAAAYYGTDRHGNVTDLTDDDGVVQARYAYSDYGVQTSESVATDAGLARNPFGYAGEQADDDGSLYLRARVYEPATMRFTSEDPAERFDRYNYADLNPIMMVDPSGHAPEWDEIVDLVTGGLALASLAGSAIMAAFTGGLSLTGLGIMGIGSDVVTMLAVTARTVDREMPELEILDHDGENVLFGVELAFGVLGAAGAAADLFQLDVAEALYAVERDADRIFTAATDIAPAVQPSSRIKYERFGAPDRPRKFNIVNETERGDALIPLLDEHLASTQARVEAIRTFNQTHRNKLDDTLFFLRGNGAERVLGKIDTILESGGEVESLAKQISDLKIDWVEVKFEVQWVGGQHYTTPGQSPPPPPRPHELNGPSSRDEWGRGWGDDEAVSVRIPDEAFF